MTRDIIDVQYPTLDHTESIANIGITKTTVTQANGITIADAFSNNKFLISSVNGGISISSFAKSPPFTYGKAASCGLSSFR